MTYTSLPIEETKDKFYTTFIAIRNKITGKTRLVEANEVVLKPEVVYPKSTKSSCRTAAMKTRLLPRRLRHEASKQLIKSFRQAKPSPLPELSWADRQSIWDLMVKKESGMYKRKDAKTILDRHSALQPRMRAILLDWLIEVCEVYRLHRETFYLAVDFIDRFLGVAPTVPKNRLQLIGITCLFIGAKIEEICPPKLQEFAYDTDGACTEKEILQMELMVLKGLNWGLSPMTPNSWMRLYMQICNGSRKPFDESFSLPAYSGLPFSHAMQLVDLCMLDIGSLEFNYSILATSALYHTESEAIALSVSGEITERFKMSFRDLCTFIFRL